MLDQNLSFYKYIENSYRETLKLRKSGYESIMSMNSPFAYIARFTPLHKFPSEHQEFAFWCNAVAVWIKVLTDGKFTHVVAVRNVTQDRRPNWEVPSGHTEPETDKDAFHSAVRELLEETGNSLAPAQIRPLANYLDWEKKRCALIFTAAINLKNLVLGELTLGLEDGTQVYLPHSSVNTSEIDRVALVPIGRLSGIELPLIFREFSRHIPETTKGQTALLSEMAKDKGEM